MDLYYQKVIGTQISQGGSNTDSGSKKRSLIYGNKEYNINELLLFV